MGRKTVKKTYTTSYAKGQRTKITGNRYLINISLTSIKAEPDFKDTIADRTGEFYFRVKKQRIPYEGVIKLAANQSFAPGKTAPFSLFLAFMEIKKERRDPISVPIKLFEADPGKDDLLVDYKIEIRAGQTTEFQILKGKNIKVKVRISASKTRY